MWKSGLTLNWVNFQSLMALKQLSYHSWKLLWFRIVSFCNHSARRLVFSWCYVKTLAVEHVITSSSLCSSQLSLLLLFISWRSPTLHCWSFHRTYIFGKFKQCLVLLLLLKITNKHGFSILKSNNYFVNIRQSI